MDIRAVYKLCIPTLLGLSLLGFVNFVQNKYTFILSVLKCLNQPSEEPQTYYNIITSILVDIAPIDYGEFKFIL